MVVNCNLDVPGIADIQQGSVMVMTDAHWAGDVNDGRSYFGMAIRVKILLKTRGIQCMRFPRSRTWFV